MIVESEKRRRDRSLLTVFLLTAFPIHLYSYYNSFREFPAWLARLNTGDLVTTVALTQFFTLLETIIIFIPLSLFMAILPKQIPRQVVATLLLTISSIWAIGAHLYIEALRAWGMVQYGIAGVIYLLMILLVLWIGVQVQRTILSINERLVVLSGLYIVLDLIGFVVLGIGILI